MDPIVTVDDTQRIVEFNAAAEGAFGWTRTQMLGETIDRLIPDRFAIHRDHIEHFGATGTRTRSVMSRKIAV